MCYLTRLKVKECALIGNTSAPASAHKPLCPLFPHPGSIALELASRAGQAVFMHSLYVQVKLLEAVLGAATLILVSLHCLCVQVKLLQTVLGAAILMFVKEKAAAALLLRASATRAVAVAVSK